MPIVTISTPEGERSFGVEGNVGVEIGQSEQGYAQAMLAWPEGLPPEGFQEALKEARFRQDGHENTAYFVGIEPDGLFIPGQIVKV